MVGFNAVGTQAIGTNRDGFNLTPIQYPNNPPNQDKLDKTTFGLNNVVGKTESIFTQHEKTIEYGGQQWEGNFELIELNDYDIMPWKAWIASLEGSTGFFEMKPPRQSSRGNVSQNGKVKSITRPDKITIKGLSSGTSNIFKAGDYIQIKDTDELKMVMNDEDSNGSGEVTVDIQPKIRQKPSNDTTVETQSPVGLFRLDNDEPGWTEREHFTDLSFSFIEVVKSGY
jgi:hypothetical protein